MIKKIKEGKGITLVALVITILVLLILAGVTINLVLGNNGILNRTKEAGLDYRKAAVKEKIELAIVDIQTEEIANNNRLTMDKIIEKLPGKIEDITIRKEGAQGKGTCEKFKYTIKRNFEVVMEDIEDPIKTILSLDKTNMELYLTQTETITATVEQTDNTSVIWKSDNDTIVTVDSNGKVTAIGAGETKITATTQDGSEITESCSVAIWWTKPYEQMGEYTDGSKVAILPKGFQVSLKEDMKKIENGLVVRNANDKNEFVWIPVDSSMPYTYARYNYGILWGSYANYSEPLPEDERESVATYKGYYIGRYESGTEEQRTSESQPLTQPLVQREKYTYNYLTQLQMIPLITQMYTTQREGVQSKLSSSYAWDTALKFIQTKNSSYPTNSQGGNYALSYVLKTGLTTSVNNIYDMGGNQWEMTTENYNNKGTITCATRGGAISYTATSAPASARDYYTANNKIGPGFRITLFL